MLVTVGTFYEFVEFADARHIGAGVPPQRHDYCKIASLLFFGRSEKNENRV